MSSNTWQFPEHSPENGLVVWDKAYGHLEIVMVNQDLAANYYF